MRNVLFLGITLLCFWSCKNETATAKKEEQTKPITITLKDIPKHNEINDIRINWQNIIVLKELIINLSPKKSIPLKADSICQDLFSKTSFLLSHINTTKQNIPQDIAEYSVSSRFLRLETYLTEIKNITNDANQRKSYDYLNISFKDVFTAYNSLVDEINRLSEQKLKREEIHQLIKN